MTKEEFHRIITNPNKNDGYELHLKYCWDTNNSKSIFYLTGLDMSHVIPPYRIEDELPREYRYKSSYILNNRE